MKNTKSILTSSTESEQEIYGNPSPSGETSTAHTNGTPVPYVVGGDSTLNWGIRGSYNAPGMVNASNAWSSGIIGSNRNVIVKKTYTRATTVASADGYNASVTYHDGVGTVQQSIDVKASPSGKDMVTPYEDAYLQIGEVRSYLPYPAASAVKGQFRENALSEQASYFTGEFGASAKAYVKQKFEVSSRGMLTEASMPGSDASKVYDTTLASLTDKVYKVSYNSTSGGFTVAPAYRGIGTVTIKQLVIDEDGRQSEVYSDESGKKVMTRRIGSEGNADTYYVYDDFGRVVYIISPEGAALLEAGASYSSDSDIGFLWSYIYIYDHKGRNVERRFPGRDWEYFVYDSGQRVIMYQVGRMRSAGNADNKGYWIRYFYDEVGRLMGKTMNTTSATRTRESLQALADAGSEILLSQTAVLEEYHYDSSFEYEYRDIDVVGTYWLAIYNSTKDTAWTSAASADTNRIFFWPDGTIKRDYLIGRCLDAEGRAFLAYYVPKNHTALVTTLVNGTANCLLTSVKPILHVLPHVNTPVKAEFTFATVSGVCTSSDKDYRTRGLKTAEYIAVLGDGMETTGQLVTRFFYYDSNGLLIQMAERNAMGGISRYSSKYGFSGQCLTRVEQHQAGPSASVDTKRTDYTYDSHGRLLNESVSLNGVTGMEEYSYDEMGRIEFETREASKNGLVNIVYTRNILGLPTSINTPHYYLENIVYSDTGKVTSTTSQSDVLGLNNMRSVYSYDHLGVLRRATIPRVGKSSAVYSMDYDLNGNIRNYGCGKGQRVMNQTYFYNGNTLMQVSRSASDPADRPGRYRFQSDSNGNVLYNADQSLEFGYNLLNLVSSAGNNTFNTSYTWLADGTKVSVTGAGNLSGKGCFYLGSVKYDAATGEKTTQFTGGVLNSSGKTTLHLKDHLGSIRMIMEGGIPVAFNEYSPFGELDPDSSINSFQGVAFPAERNTYLYTGKEGQLAAPSAMLDYGARMYFPALGRWGAYEPLADMFPDQAPYAYSNNDPVGRVDMFGLMIDDPDYIWGHEWIDPIVITPRINRGVLSDSIRDLRYIAPRHGNPVDNLRVNKAITRLIRANYGNGISHIATDSVRLHNLSEWIKEHPEAADDLLTSLQVANEVAGVPSLLEETDPDIFKDFHAKYPAASKYMKIIGDVEKVTGKAGDVIGIAVAINNIKNNWKGASTWNKIGMCLELASPLHWTVEAASWAHKGFTVMVETFVEAKMAVERWMWDIYYKGIASFYGYGW